MVIYHTGMRPNEVLALKIKDINIKKDLITIVPDDQRDNSKTKNIREVPMSQELSLLIKEWLKHEHSDECYLFGSPFTPGRGNSGYHKAGRGANHPDYFKPSMTRISRDTVTKLWNTLIISNKELGIKKYLYASKHTGSDDKILAGIDVDALKDMYGHTSKYMTLTYITKLKEVHQQQIKNLAPAFVPANPTPSQ